MYVSISRGLRVRVWIALQLIRLAAWICGMGIRVRMDEDTP